MYLEKLEIQGFKSFATKNVLTFPGKVAGHSGMTAIVGPNGSGKSNVADAVRWALGEQSMKTLRGKKSEDIIFSGSDKKGKLGMAEVSLYLNNVDHQASLDYEQVVITRRLFRDGESEYLINGSRVRLLDIQMLLAKANFGQKTYSVIGQGMVENFLNTSLAERKEFFDEATGVKQYQIKREDSLNKLKLSLENLGQSQMLLGEIEPHLRVLTRQVSRFAKKEELATELKMLSLDFYGRQWQELNSKLLKVNETFLSIEKTKREKETRLKSLEKELTALERHSAGNDFSVHQSKLSSLQADKDQLTAQLAKLDAYLEMKLEAAGKFDLSFLNNRQQLLIAQSQAFDENLKLVAEQLLSDKQSLNKLQAEKQALVDKLNGINIQLKVFSHEAPAQDGEIKKRLAGLITKLEQAQVHEDIDKIKSLIVEIREELEELVSGVEAEKRHNLAAWQQEALSLSEDKDHLLETINQVSSDIRAKEERQKMIDGQQSAIKRELSEITRKLAEQTKAPDPEAKRQERSELEVKLTKINQQLIEARNRFGDLQANQESKRSELFALQKSLHQLQTEVSSLASQLSDCKIEAARHETKLEDLENEIRENFGDLPAIKAAKPRGEIDHEATHERIRQLRRQLDSIGAIDPEVEKEYEETKERFDFLSTQVNDLTGTIQSLEQVIAELDGVIKDRFDKEFKIIESKFSEYFKILFNGGNAKIIKVMAEDLEKETDEASPEETLSFKDKVMKRLKALSRHDSVGLAGVDIMATPPGKKIQSVAMLSGGERALTAIALICAIISANPAPFVVLDEVDAALDEANSERLAKILDDLSHKTQFIAISHNRAMMRRASILYGVTMGDDSVSKLLSVRLEEVKE